MISTIIPASKATTNQEEMLRNAKRHCFFIGLNDSGAELCKANTLYGIAGIHYIQNQLGMAPNATFITTPDMTITRNANRWRSGFGYGGKISWGVGYDDLIILDVKPNACGMLVGGLEELPDIESLIRKLHELETSIIEIDGVKVNWDFYRSNHFIDLFVLKPVTKLDQVLLPYAFILHSSPVEFTGDNESGFGIYYDKSKQLYEMAEPVETPLGKFHILTGIGARKYFERYKCAENFSKKKRKLAQNCCLENL